MCKQCFYQTSSINYSGVIIQGKVRRQLPREKFHCGERGGGGQLSGGSWVVALGGYSEKSVQGVKNQGTISWGVSGEWLSKGNLLKDNFPGSKV